MKRTTIVLPDDLDTQLRYEARRRGVSMTELAREAITEYLVQATGEGEDLSIFDLGDGGATDVGRNSERYVAEAIEAHHRQDERGAAH